jgi:methionyl-tRNA formyltransferase
VRAFDPFPGASTTLDGDTLKVWRARVMDGHGEPGEVLTADGDTLVVATGHGALRLEELQRPGGRRVPARAFLQAQPPLAGRRLGAVA